MGTESKGGWEAMSWVKMSDEVNRAATTGGAIMPAHAIGGHGGECKGVVGECEHARER